MPGFIVSVISLGLSTMCGTNSRSKYIRPDPLDWYTYREAHLKIISKCCNIAAVMSYQWGTQNRSVRPPISLSARASGACPARDKSKTTKGIQGMPTGLMSRLQAFMDGCVSFNSPSIPLDVFFYRPKKAEDNALVSHPPRPFKASN